MTQALAGGSDMLAVQTGIRDYMRAAQIAGTRWYRDYPLRLAGTTFAVGDAGPWAAVGWPHLHETGEERLTLPVGYGTKRITYRVGLVLGFQYRIPTELPDGEDEDVWVVSLDGLLDDVCNRLRADPTLGGVVFQAGETMPGGGAPQLTIKRDLPRKDGGILHVWTAVEFDALVIIQA